MKSTSKEEFYEDTKRFYDAGLLRDVYVDDIKCICNASNNHYICFPYFKSEKSNSQIGFMFQAEHLKTLISDKFFIYKLIYEKDQDFINKWSCLTNDKLFNALLERKKQTDVEGPSKFVDLALEEEIMKKEKAK